METISPHDEVLIAVGADLESIGSTLVIEGSLEPGLDLTIRDIVTRTILRATADPIQPSSAISVRYAVTTDFANIAVAQAEAERHPAEPSMAAEVIFDVALPILSRRLAEVDPIYLAQTLHNEIWRRFPPGAIAYVEFILNKLARSQRDERLVISRELHDRVAHRIALALQRVELAKLSPESAVEHLEIAESEMRSSLLDVQDLAVALRPMVGERTLEDAVLELIDRLPAFPPVEMESSGTPHLLLESAAEQLFTIIVEAVRNGRRHANADRIIVKLKWRPAHLLITVEDDGGGFNASTSAPSGLRTMSERAQVIGARINVQSDRAGTIVRIDAPLGRITRIDT